MNTLATHTYPDHLLSGSTQRLLRHLENRSWNEQRLTRELEELISAHPLQPHDYPRIASSYSRTILHRDQSGFELLVARWSKGAVTPIHGHPQFTYVYLLSGQLTMELFEKEQNLVRKTSTLVCRPSEHFYTQGSAGTFDNAIHRVTADEESLSLHIYSDDALKGEVFS